MVAGLAAAFLLLTANCYAAKADDLNPAIASQVVPEQPAAQLHLLQTLSVSHVVYSLVGFESGSDGVTWSPDGARLAAYARDGAEIDVWDAGGQRILDVKRYGLAISPSQNLDFIDGSRRLLVTPSSSAEHNTDYLNNVMATVLDVASGEFVQDIPGPLPGHSWRENEAGVLAVSPDQSTFAVTYGSVNHEEVAVYSSKDGKKIVTLPNPPVRLFIDVESLAFSPNGQLLAVGNTDGRLAIYDMQTMQLLRVVDVFPGLSLPHLPHIGVISFSPDGKLIAVGGDSGGSGWLLPNGRLAAPGHGTFKTSDPPDPVRVFQVDSGVQITSAAGFFPGIWFNGVRQLAWSSKTNLVAFVAMGGDLHVWDPTHPTRPHVVIPLGWTAQSLAFSPDGSKLAVCVATGVKIFQVSLL